MESGTWPCEAYGQEAAAFGALCFIAGQHQRVCASQEECHQVVHGEQQRVFQRIQELAANGAEWAADLAEEITLPEQLLNSEGAGPEEPRPPASG